MNIYSLPSIQSGSPLFALVILFWAMTAYVHILFAAAVNRDATSIERTGREVELVAPAVWATATLLGGVIVAAIYWFMHHSALRRP